ncbi:hypothetical protein DEU56DRAFT_756120 [Suillus clintonianus]|uniref:uncharacterized protein n=1 Tax=Suillus clintonianus TaxID=1904413 RepID=UPI001B85C775|nr:uncharacterized protein DEU56DRAFT_756120 [Suillus clintonianus]KAG2137549.1 hypothetical protein DEU56DRAFT_756120 [Suillus clintonianus]
MHSKPSRSSRPKANLSGQANHQSTRRPDIVRLAVWGWCGAIIITPRSSQLPDGPSQRATPPKARQLNSPYFGLRISPDPPALASGVCAKLGETNLIYFNISMQDLWDMLEELFPHSGVHSSRVAAHLPIQQEQDELVMDKPI